MLFLNNRPRNRTVSGIGLHDGSCTHKVGRTCLIGGCLALLTGIILIIVGVISETRTTLFVGVGIASLGVGFFLTSLLCFYAKLDICYNNWAYGSRVLPANLETPPPVPHEIVTISPFAPPLIAADKRLTSTQSSSPTPITVAYETELCKSIEPPPVRHSDHMP